MHDEDDSGTAERRSLIEIRQPLQQNNTVKSIFKWLHRWWTPHWQRRCKMLEKNSIYDDDVSVVPLRKGRRMHEEEECTRKTTAVQRKKKKCDRNQTTPRSKITPWSQPSNDSTDDEPSIDNEDARKELHLRWWCKSGSGKALHVDPPLMTDDGMVVLFQETTPLTTTVYEHIGRNYWPKIIRKVTKNCTTFGISWSSSTTSADETSTVNFHPPLWAD